MVAADAIVESCPAPTRPRQLRLFSIPNPLTTRLGDAFFRALPRAPGVYFFRDESGRLLYVGQSNNLRARIGSYRHVSFERHPRRTLRLVHLVRRIEWQLCDSPVAAIERERELLLTLRPPFNRAGVWQGTPWWLYLEHGDTTLRLWLRRSETLPTDATAASLPAMDLIKVDPVDFADGSQCFGPYRAELPFVYAALVRTVLRACRPGLGLAEFPAGWLDARRLAETRLEAGHGAPLLAEQIQSFLRGKEQKLVSPMDLSDSEEECPSPSVEEQLLQQDLEILQEFFARRQAAAELNC